MAAKKTAAKKAVKKVAKKAAKIPVEMTAEQKKAADKAAKAAAKKAAAKRAPRVNRSPKAAEVKPLSTLGKEGIFHVEAQFNDQVITGRTDSIAEGIMSIDPMQLNTKVVFNFTLASDDEIAAAAEDTENAVPFKVVNKVLMIPFARRLFTNKTAAHIFEKGVKMALGISVDNGEEAQ